MKKAKNLSKQIISIIIIIMLCNFIIPNYSYAKTDKLTKNDKSLINGFAQMFCIIPDVVIEALQNMFVSNQGIKMGKEYAILYSPGTIFSGKIPAFDIDFITHKQDEEENEEESKEELYEYTAVDLGIDENYWDVINIEDSKIYGTEGIISKLILEGILYDSNRSENTRFRDN